jgi:hypothetical protein
MGFAYLGSPIFSFISGLMSSIAHASPILKYDEFILSNYFGNHQILSQTIAASLIQQTLPQIYKVKILKYF